MQGLVSGMVFQFLDSLRKSRDLEERHALLSRTAKGATTRELHRLSASTAKYILNSGLDLESIGTEQIEKAIELALSNNVDNSKT